MNRGQHSATRSSGRCNAYNSGRIAVDRVVFASGDAISVVCRQLLGLSSPRALRLNWTLTNASIRKLLVGRGDLHQTASTNTPTTNRSGRVQQAV